MKLMRMKISTRISEGKFTTKKKLVVLLQNFQGESASATTATTTAKTPQNLLMAVEIIQLITVHLEAHHAAQLTRTSLREFLPALAILQDSLAIVLQALAILRQALAILRQVLRQVLAIARQVRPIALREVA